LNGCNTKKYKKQKGNKYSKKYWTQGS